MNNGANEMRCAHGEAWRCALHATGSAVGALCDAFEMLGCGNFRAMRTDLRRAEEHANVALRTLKRAQP